MPSCTVYTLYRLVSPHLTWECPALLACMPGDSRQEVAVAGRNTSAVSRNSVELPSGLLPPPEIRIAAGGGASQY